MTMRLQEFGRSLLLTALVLGLNVLGVLAITHARHPSHVRANVAHGHGSSLRRANRDQCSADADEGQLPDSSISSNVAKKHHTWPVLTQPALYAELVRLFAPEFTPAPLSAAPLVATGSAARAPGAPRGPPTA